MNLRDVQTPGLILDKGKLIRNIQAMHRRLRYLGATLRPHGKTAKSIDVLDLVLPGREGGITVSTLKEAEYYFGHGIADITYAVGIAPVKLDRVAALMEQGARISILLDSMDQVEFAAVRAREKGLVLPILIEIDCDGHRAGIAPEDPLLVEIGRRVHGDRGLELEGVLTHAGGSYGCRLPEDLKSFAERERDAAVRCADTLHRSGLPCPTVSVGSTPTASFAADLTGVTEVRAGVYMFQDLVMAGLGVCAVEDIALSVLASVIGHQRSRGWAVVDAGWTATSSDRGTATQVLDQGFGLVCDVDGKPLEDLIINMSNQEHGIITGRGGGACDVEQLPVGSLVRILPNHACATAAMHDSYRVVDGARDVIEVWPRVNGW